MLRRQAYRFYLRPSAQQLRNLRQFAGSCRFVYNKALALNTARYNKKEKRLGYAGLCALLPNWKREHPFLSEVPAQALRQALKDLERAYTNFFLKRSEFPKFKKKGQESPDFSPGRRSVRRIDSARILWLLQAAGIAPKQWHISFSCSQGRRLPNDTSRSTCR